MRLDLNMQMDANDRLSGQKPSLFAWFLLALLLGLGLRVWGLGEMRFTLAEAQIAQSAWQMATGDVAGLPGNMSYAGSTALLFYLFEPSFFFARLMPVLAGSSLILVSWFWQDALGKRLAFLLALGMAIDPILVSFSRQIVTPIFVLAGICWAFTALKYQRPVLAGSMLAFAFLGGYSFWVLALVVVAVFLVWRKRGQFEFIRTSYSTKAFLVPLLTSFVVSLLLISSAFLLCTEGLGGVGAGLVELLLLFGKSYEIPAYQLIIAAIAYNILPLFFAIWALVEDLLNHRPLKNLPFLLGWAFSVLLSVLLGRQDLGLLAFAAVLAWLGAAEIILTIIEQGTDKREIILGVTFFQIVILVYIQMVSGRLIDTAPNTQDFRLALLAILAGVLLLVISTILVRLGWSGQVSGQALRNSLLIVLLVMTIGISLRSVRSQQESMTLSLLAGPIVLPNNDIEIVMDEIDRDGRADKTEITYDLGDLEQQLSWFFRNQTAWKNTQSLSQTDLVISASDADFSAADAYRGRNVVLFRQIDKLVVKPVDFLKTLLGEPLPLVSQKGVLWVRLNLFTGAN